MGERRKRKGRFLAENPACCFCAGKRPTETEDHQPARVFFADRQWPEGFVFPACRRCNDISRQSERLIALFVHGETQKEQRSKYREHIRSIQNDFPGLIEDLFPDSANEVRQILRKKGLKRPAGVPLNQIPVIKISQEFWSEHIDMVSRKIFLALHYQCYGKILPDSGGMWIYPMTNADVESSSYLEDFLEKAPNLASPIRNKNVLSEQFSVRWNSVPGKNAGIFIVHLHGSFIFSAITTDDISLLKDQNDERLFRPSID